MLDTPFWGGVRAGSKAYVLASRVMASWMAARVTKVSRVPARFSKSLARRRFRPNQRPASAALPTGSGAQQIENRVRRRPHVGRSWAIARRAHRRAAHLGSALPTIRTPMSSYLVAASRPTANTGLPADPASSCPSGCSHASSLACSSKGWPPRTRLGGWSSSPTRPSRQPSKPGLPAP
jgi:hypothetical protein